MSAISAIQRLVECESPTEDLAACHSVVDLAVDIANEVLSFPAEKIIENGRPVFWWGSKEPKILLLCHLDTVWPKGSFKTTWQISGDIATGPGVFDMKAGFVQALYSLINLSNAATTELAKLVMQISAFEDPKFGTTAVPTVMQSGTTTNTVPALAKLDIDVRSFTLAELNRIDKSIRGLKSEIAVVEVSGGISRPPLEESSCKELYEKLEKVAKELGLNPIGSASVGGASDGNIAASTGAKVLDGLGAEGVGAHAPNESIKISTIEPKIKLTTAFINELLK